MRCAADTGLFALRAVAWLLAARAPLSARAQQELIAGGQTTDARAFPWHVGVYRLVDRATGVYTQDCGGTLISSRLVVSAAHCFWDDSIGRPISASRYKVAAGKAARDWSFEEADGQRMPVADIAMSRRYRGRRRFTQHDIALLLLSGDIVVTSAVGFAQVDWLGRWDAEQLVANSKGVVAGWGITEEDTASDRLRFVELPYVDSDVCFDSLSPELQPWLTSDKFCAGYAGSDMSVCPGDSGGGLVFGGLAEPHVGRRLLRGVVSVAFKPVGNTDACYAQHYAGFTRVTGDALLALARSLPDVHRIALLRLAHAAPADFAHAPDVGFVKLHTELRNFGDAWAECVRQGARLVVLDSERKRRALDELLAANPGFGNRAYAAFVGAHRLFNGAVFASLDGSALSNASFVRWQDGQPDGGVDGVERCVVMHARTALLHDDRCERLLGAICEIPLRPSTRLRSETLCKISERPWLFFWWATAGDLGQKNPVLIELVAFSWLQLLVYSLLGDQTADESTLIHEALHGCASLRGSNSFKRTMRIMMTRSNHAAEIAVANFVPLTKETFLGMANMAYSYYTALRDIVRQAEG